MAKKKRKQQGFVPRTKTGVAGGTAAVGLIAIIWRHIDQGQGKKALDYIQAVRAGQAGVFDLRAAKFCALAARAAELYRADVLAAAADAVARVKAQSVQLIGEALHQMSPIAQLHTVRWLPLDAALSHLNAFNTPRLQRSLADRVMASAPKDAPLMEAKLTALAGEHWLAADSQACRAARSLMHEGAWLAAQETLASVPRGSVFAPWRLFCRFMAAHTSGSSSEAHKSGTLLLRQWPDFALASVVTTVVSALDGQTAKPSRLHALLFPGVDLARRAAALRALEAKHGRFVEQVAQLGGGIYPADPKLGSWSVLQALSRKAYDAPSQAGRFMEAAERFADSAQGGCYAAQMVLGLSHWYQDMWPANAAAAYLEALQRRFADAPQTLAQAKGLFVAWLARKIADCKVCEHCTRGVGLSRLRACFPAAKFTAEHARLSTELGLVAIRLDPQYRPHYDAALKLAERETAPQRLVDELLGEMAARFVDDAPVCAQLSRRLAARGELADALHYARIAQQRAAHDGNLDDLVAALRLRQANETNARGVVLGADDKFLKAAAVERASIQPALQCASLLGALQRQMSAASEALDKLAAVELVARLRALGLIIAHLQARAAKPFIRQVQQLVGPFELLDEADRRRVMQAMNGTSALVFAIPRPAAGLEALWRPFLLHISEEFLPDASLSILEAGGFAAVVEALDARQKRDPDAFSSEAKVLRGIADCLRTKQKSVHSFMELIPAFGEMPGLEDIQRWADYITRLRKVIVGDSVEGLHRGAAATLGAVTESAHTDCGASAYFEDADDEDDEDAVEDDESRFDAAAAAKNVAPAYSDADDVDDVDAFGLLNADGPYQRSVSDAQLLEITRSDKRIGPRAIKELEKVVQAAGVPASPGPHHQRLLAMLEGADDLRLLLRFARIQLELAPQTRTSPALRRLLVASGKVEFVPKSTPAELSSMEPR